MICILSGVLGNIQEANLEEPGCHPYIFVTKAECLTLFSSAFLTPMPPYLGVLKIQRVLYNGRREPASLIKLVMGLEPQAFAWVGLEATQSWANSRGSGDLQLQSTLMPI